MEQINEITNYEKAKESIYKWRDTNKQKYLIYTSAYNLNRYNNLDPEKKMEKIKRAKQHIKARIILNMKEKGNYLQKSWQV